jgi:hypothetical protein
MLNAQQRVGGRAPVASRPARGLAVRVRAVAAVPKPAQTTTAAKAGLTPEVGKDLYYDMLLGREFEEMCAQVSMGMGWDGMGWCTRASTNTSASTQRTATNC